MSSYLSSERLEECEDNLRESLRDLEALLSVSLPASRGPEETKRNVRSAERKAEAVDRLLSEYSNEVQRVPSRHQHQYSITLAQYKHQLATIKRQLASYSAKAARSDLFMYDDPSIRGQFGGHSGYDQMLKNTETLHMASQSLARAQKVSAETDEVAYSIIDELGEQKETLLRTRNTVQGFDEQLDVSRSLLRKMACQTIKNRFVLITAILLELIVLIIVTWWKFFS